MTQDKNISSGNKMQEFKNFFLTFYIYFSYFLKMKLLFLSDWENSASKADGISS
jgi:hypothetical protein